MRCSCASAVAVLWFALPAALANEANWPQWRGPDRTDVSTETGLLDEWPEGGPPRVWLFENAGIGYSGPAVVGDRLFTMGARDGVEYLISLETNDGKEVWAAKIGDQLKNGWGDGPRGTPTVDGDRVYAMGGQGDLICAQTSDGKILWQRSMSELGGRKPNWGYTESVLIDGDRVVCTPGGSKGTMAALDKMTGETLWQAAGLTDGAQYASIIVADVDGSPQYIQLTQEHLFGVNPESGEVLWTSDWPGKTAVIPTPIYDDGKVYITSGYGVGCKLVEIGAGGTAEDVYVNKIMKNHHGGVIKIDDYLYGHSDGLGWVCQEFETGKLVWSKKGRGIPGKGAIAYADKKLYLLEESSGTVVLIDASPDGWQEHGRFTLDPQTKLRSPRGKVWTHPVIAGGKLYLRDQELLFCYDLRAE